MKRFIIILLFFLSQNIFGTEAIESIDINSFNESLIIEDRLSYIEDKNYTIEDIASISDSQFKSYSYSDLPNSKKVFWIKINLENTRNDERKFVLGTSKFDYIKLYYQRADGNWKSEESGKAILNDSREYLFDANSYLSFYVTPLSRESIYLKITNQEKISFQYSPLPLTLYHADYFKNYANQQIQFTYFFWGAILIMTLYNLILYFQIRTRIYLYYVLNNIGVLCFVLAQTGVLSSYFFDSFKEHELFVIFLGNFAFLSYVVFCKEVLDFKNSFPRANRIINLILIIFPSLLVFLWISPVVILQVGGLIAVAVYTYILYTAIVRSNQNIADAKIFLAGNIFYYLGIMISVTMILNILPSTVFGLSAINFVEIGTILQLTFFSLTLGYRINTMKSELEEQRVAREKIRTSEEAKRIRLIEEKNIELEKKVSDRTLDLASKNNDLNKANSEKEILLKEIHHRVKNNLQFTSSLLNLQAKQIKDEKTRKALEEGQARIRSMFMVHQNLYEQNAFGEINFEDYSNELIQNIMHSNNVDNKNITSSVNAKIDIDIERAIPLGLICNELITNTIKYAFQNRDEGKIMISLIEDDKDYVLSYADNGIGIDEKNDEEKNSLGLNLVSMLSRQLYGELKTTSKGGLKYELRFPKTIEN